MNESGKVTTVVEDHVERLAAGEGGESLLNAPEVLLFRLSLPSVDGNAGCGNTV